MMSRGMMGICGIRLVSSSGVSELWFRISFIENDGLKLFFSVLLRRCVLSVVLFGRICLLVFN